MITIEHGEDQQIVTIRASGKLTSGDYDAAIPELEHAMKLAEGPLRMLIRLEDFSGWEMGAAWKDLKFDMRHGPDLGRIAVLGETRLEEWGTKLSAPFFGADMKFFPIEQEEDAMAWLKS